MNIPEREDFRVPITVNLCAAWGDDRTIHETQCNFFERGKIFCKHVRNCGPMGFLCGLGHWLDDKPEVT